MKLTEETLPKLVEYWNTKKYSLNDLGDKFNCSGTTIRNWLKKAELLGHKVEKVKKGYGFKAGSYNHLEKIKETLEHVTDVEKFYFKEIIKLKNNNLTNKQILAILDINHSRLDRLISKMKLLGKLPYDDYSGGYEGEESYRPYHNLEQELKIINTFEKLSNKNTSIKQITDVMGISRSRLFRLVYKHKIRNENI